MAAHDNIYSDLHDRLVIGEFPPGQRLKPEDLSQHYSASGSAIREICHRLASVGLLDYQEQRGFRLPPQSAVLRSDLTRFRIVLECEGARRSIRNGGIAWEARLIAAHHKLSHIESRVRSDRGSVDLLKMWTQTELEFHQTLIEECGLEVLIQTHRVIYQRFRQQLIISDRSFVFVPENIVQHAAILDAALARDEGLIATLIQEHLVRNLERKIPDTDADAG